MVRVRKNHNGAHKRKLVHEVRSGAPDGFIEVPVTRQSYRAKSGHALAERRTARLARMAVRFRQLELRPADGYEGDPVPVWAIDVVEEAPPKQEAAIEWCLMTTVPVATVEEAIEMAGYYTQRWRIEDLLRVLKSGCKVEDIGMQDASRLQLVITLYTVIAWRLLLMTLLGREVPETAAEIMFTETELRFLADYASLYKKPSVTNLALAVLLVAIMGGFRNRKSDPWPAVEVMWRGYSRLENFALTYQVRD